MQALADLLLNWHDHQPLLYASITVLSMVVLGTVFALLGRFTAAWADRLAHTSNASEAGD